MEFKTALSEDFKKITEFYKYLIENTENMKECCRWIYGLHPNDELIKKYIETGSMYYLLKDGVMVAVAAVTMEQGEEYHLDCWKKQFDDDEIAAVHILGVSPDYARQGIAKEFVKRIILLAKEKNKKAVRLDSLLSNKPAHSMYESIGFLKVGVEKWYVSNVGYDDFVLFEYLL